MKTQKDIETMLESTTPKLRQDEAQVLWQRIEVKISEPAIPSPFFNMFTVGRMSIAAFALILIVGVGGTTVAAQQARPGDVLFPVERALEEVRLTLTVNDNSRAALQLEFAEKRLAELRSLIEETPTKNIPDVSHSASSTIKFSGEADVFTDITIVSIEVSGRKTSFRTDAQSREEVVEEIVRRYDVSQNLVEAGLDFEIENRASRVSDINNTRSDDERIDESIKLLSSLVDDENEEERKRFVNEVLDTLDFDRDYRVDIRDDEEDKRIEIRNGDERVRIREKDGEVRIDIKSDGKDDRKQYEDNDSGDSDWDDEESEEGRDDNDDDRDNDESDRDEEENDSADSSVDDSWNDEDDNDDSKDDENISANQDIESMEVRVKEGRAEVEISYDDGDDEFTLPYISRATLVTALSVKTGLDESYIESVLELEIKD